eukprot:TRINITY_DN5033_c0_g1_i4.p2 TRINITY_DN5033_c0_g1~~TRINITY_DN5033_c0_g1_i4.p2  ORF type:complete len:544 (-),score=136.48 TRINITY_DN5033_c0_g1_i4:2886-4517(-)
MKAAKEEDEQKRRDRRAKERRTRKAVTIQNLVENARRKQEQHDLIQAQQDAKEAARQKTANPDERDLGQNTRRAFFREFGKIVERADVILEVLDARDPLGCRCKQIENFILRKDPSKKIILILNKIDLIPSKNIQQWLQYLRAEYPTIAFKASTQKQHNNLKISRKKEIYQKTSNSAENVSFTSECYGAASLLQVLKNYCRSLDIKTHISVGVIGYPNVGKSSLINSMKRTKTMKTGAQPGVTRKIEEIVLDKNIKLIDSPGVVFSANTANADLILRNQVQIDSSLNDVDYLTLVSTIVKKCATGRLMEIYKIAFFDGPEDFLENVAKSYGKLRKGGVADRKAAATIILRDWYSGKIPFYTIPPERKGVHVGSAVVANWGKAFNVDDIQDAATIAAEIPMEMQRNETDWISTGISELADDDLDLVKHLEQMSVAAAPQLGKRKRSMSVDGASSEQATGEEDEGEQFNESDLNTQRKKSQRAAVKKKRKKRRKEAALAADKIGELGKYDFATDFIPDVDLTTQEDTTAPSDKDVELFDVEKIEF